MHDHVDLYMEASPAEVWALVSDVTRIGEFSPETFEAEWVGGATGPEAGASFRGHVKRNGRGPIYWTDCRVTQAEPERVFEFEVLTGGKVVNTWGYELEPSGTGTKVTESYRLADNVATRVYWFLAGWARAKTNREGMRTTLERIKAVVEAA